MIDQSKQIGALLKKNDIRYGIYLPSSKLVPIVKLLEADKDFVLIPVSREEEAFGICAGFSLTGKKSAIFIQDAGFGNSLVPFISLITSYDFPLLAFVADESDRDLDVVPKYELAKQIKKIIHSLHSEQEASVSTISDFLSKEPDLLGRNIVLL